VTHPPDLLRPNADHPPVCKYWYIDQLVDVSMVAWFLKIAGTLEDLQLAVSPEHEEGFLAQMLAMAAIAAANLRELVIYNHTSSGTVHSLVFLSQIQDLHLEGWHFPGTGLVTEMQCLTGLQSLKVGIQIPPR